jgi:hypothetical protein
MSGETFISRAITKGLMCDVCDRTDDVVEIMTSPMYWDDGIEEPQKGVVRIYRLCRKCINTCIAVLDGK